MSDVFQDDTTPFVAGVGAPAGARETTARSRLARYGASLVLVGAATLLAFVVEHLIAAPNLTLIFVLPVVIAATLLGWGPALLAVAASVLAFDFFFTQPYFSFAIANASDIWAATLLLITATIVSTVAGEARRRANESRRAASQAQALQRLAHVVIEGRRREEVVDAAADALHAVFDAPAAIFAVNARGVRLAASAGDAKITHADEEAAAGAVSDRVHTRAETYPYDQARFEFWPLTTAAGDSYALGVNFGATRADRPAAPEQWVDVVAAYLAAAHAGQSANGG